MTNRVFNFNPGPCTLPLDVLKTVQAEMLDYRGTGMSIIESSHRAPEFDQINEDAIRLAREVLGLTDDYHVMYLTGGASTQFCMIPMNLLPDGGVAAYADTGSWSSKAIKEVGILGKKAHTAFSGKAGNYVHIPTQEELDVPSDAAYLHITTNNTIRGTEYHYVPETGGVPLIADMSSDIASRPLDYTKFDMIYAGAQKNLGPAGATFVAMKDSMLQKTSDTAPTMLRYKTHAEKKSLYNTPPVFAIYVIKLVFEWVKANGGLEGIGKINEKKQQAIYGVVDGDPDYFRAPVEKGSRSWMNLVFRLPSEDLEKKLISEAKAAGFVGLKGHRSVGGIRVSLYNALPLEGAEKLAAFLKDFRKKN